MDLQIRELRSLIIEQSHLSHQSENGTDSRDEFNQIKAELSTMVSEVQDKLRLEIAQNKSQIKVLALNTEILQTQFDQKLADHRLELIE